MKKSITYILFAIALTYIVRELEYYGIRKNKTGLFAKFNTVFEETNNFDLLIIGSSRAESHYRPDILDSATGLNCYNAGMIGATMPFIEGTLEAYLEHSTAPKYVVLNIDYHMFIASDDSIRYFPSYFAYLDNDALYKKFSERDKRFVFFKWIPFYSMPYFNAKYLDNSVRGFLNVPGKYDTAYIKGYTPIPIHDPRDLDTLTYKPYSPWLKESSWASLDSIISLCHQKKIKLIFVMSPLYHKLSECIVNEKQIIEKFQKMADKEGFVLFDYSHTPISQDKNLFSDMDHLNRAGALAFSRLFSFDLAQYIKP
jgi:hypothetical protein